MAEGAYVVAVIAVLLLLLEALLLQQVGQGLVRLFRLLLLLFLHVVRQLTKEGVEELYTDMVQRSHRQGSEVTPTGFRG